MHTGKDRSESLFLLSTHTDIGFTAHGLSDINAIAGCLLVQEMINLDEAIVIMCLLNQREQKEKRRGRRFCVRNVGQERAHSLRTDLLEDEAVFVCYLWMSYGKFVTLVDVQGPRTQCMKRKYD